MPGACAESKDRMRFAAKMESEMHGGSAEHREVFDCVDRIILGKIGREHRAGENGDEIAVATAGQLAIVDAEAAAGGQVMGEAEDPAEQFARQRRVHLDHEGCRAAVPACSDPAAAGGGSSSGTPCAAASIQTDAPCEWARCTIGRDALSRDAPRSFRDALSRRSVAGAIVRTAEVRDG